MLEEFGIRLVTYDLPGFGESDPDPERNLNSSALDILNLAKAVGVTDKFWVLAHSSGAMHTLAALKYIPNKIAGKKMVFEDLLVELNQWLPKSVVPSFF